MRIAAAFIAVCLSVLPAHAGKASRTAPAPQAFPATGPRSLAVLDPANLATGLPNPQAGEILRRTLSANGAWKVVPGDMAKRMQKEYGLDPGLPCAEFQCAFDAGNALQTEYVLFGTATALPELHAFTLNLVHVPTSQVVWSRVGQIPRSMDGSRQSRKGYVLEGSLPYAVGDLDPGLLSVRKRPSLGMLGILNAGPSSPHSRVAVQRALTHAYAARSYDLLGPAETDELLAALDIRGRSAKGQDGIAPGPTGSEGAKGMGGSGNPNDTSAGAGIADVGEKMGVRYLLWTKVLPDDPEFRMDLGLYDVARHRTVKQWPAAETGDFTALLEKEDRFMTALGTGTVVPDPIAQPSDHGPRWKTIGKTASFTVALAAGAALGFLAYQSQRNADSEYRRFQAAQSEDQAAAARRNVVRQDTRTRHYGMMSGLTLALGGVVWVF